MVDNRAAAMGGLDACYGRWDTRNHPLADVHPTEFYKSLFPGQGEASLVSLWPPKKLVKDADNGIDRLQQLSDHGFPGPS